MKLTDFCFDSLEIIKLLNNNPIKKTSTFITKLNNKKIFVKKNNSSKNLFKRESNFLKNNSSKFSPNLIYSSKKYLVLSHFEGLNLLNVSKLNKKFDSLFFDFLKSFYFSKSKSEQFSSKLIVNQFFHNYKRLLISSPKIGTSLSVFDLFQNKVLYLLSYFLVRTRVRKHISKNTFYSQTIHGDLHLNNIMINKSNSELKIVDFENSVKSIHLIDLSFFYALFYFNFKKIIKSRFRIHLKFLKKNMTQSEYSFFLTLLNINLNAVSINRNFNPDCSIKFKLNFLFNFFKKFYPYKD